MFYSIAHVIIYNYTGKREGKLIWEIMKGCIIKINQTDNKKSPAVFIGMGAVFQEDKRSAFLASAFFQGLGFTVHHRIYVLLNNRQYFTINWLLQERPYYFIMVYIQNQPYTKG